VERERRKERDNKGEKEKTKERARGRDVGNFLQGRLMGDMLLTGEMLAL